MTTEEEKINPKEKITITVSLFFPDGSPFISFDNSTHEIKITNNVVKVKKGNVEEEYHGFVFIIRKIKK